MGSWLTGPPPPTPQDILAESRQQLRAFRDRIADRRLDSDFDHHSHMKQLVSLCQARREGEAHALTCLMARQTVHRQQEYALEARLLEMDAHFLKASDTMDLIKITYQGMYVLDPRAVPRERHLYTILIPLPPRKGVRAVKRFRMGIPAKGFEMLTTEYKASLDAIAAAEKALTTVVQSREPKVPRLQPVYSSFCVRACVCISLGLLSMRVPFGLSIFYTHACVHLSLSSTISHRKPT